MVLLVEVMEFQLSYFKPWKMMLWKCCIQYASKFYSISSFLISFSKKVVENKYIENVRSNCKYYIHGFFSTPKHLNHYKVYSPMAFRTFTMLYNHHFYLVSICGLLNVLFFFPQPSSLHFLSLRVPLFSPELSLQHSIFGTEPSW